jgi:hypothetical protein
MTTEDLYYDEEAEATEAKPETINIPTEELSAEVEPGAMLRVESVQDGIVTLRIVQEELEEPEEETPV